MLKFEAIKGEYVGRISVSFNESTDVRVVIEWERLLEVWHGLSI